MHILEDNVIPWLTRWKIGAGMMGEQGAESIHAHIMRLERIHQGIANDVHRLKSSKWPKIFSMHPYSIHFTYHFSSFPEHYCHFYHHHALCSLANMYVYMYMCIPIQSTLNPLVMLCCFTSSLNNYGQ